MNAKENAFVEGHWSIAFGLTAAARIVPSQQMIVVANTSGPRAQNNLGMFEPYEKFPDRLQIKRCSNATNYPAPAAFSKSTYKIYAVGLMLRYKSNIQLGWRPRTRLFDRTSALYGSIGQIASSKHPSTRSLAIVAALDRGN